MLKKILIGCSLFFSIMLYTQKLHIRVIDKNTKEPLSSVVVRYGEISGELNNYEVTDNKGKVTLNTQICYYEISSLSYISKKGEFTTKKSQRVIEIKENPTLLNEIIITGSNTPKPVKKATVLTQIISAKTLLNGGYADLQQALVQETPGMNIQKVGFGNEMSMQGLDARHILFLIDGERLTGEMAGNLDYERFNLHAIKRVEIIKGASSTLYGSRAAGAVINLITKKTKKPFTINFGSRYTQLSEKNYKNPKPKDFLYMFEKNSDKLNLQNWLSMGFNKNWITSQTDILHSSSDAFSMYQKKGDFKKYLASSNSFLKKDSIVTSSLPRPPLGISGSEHISVSQKLYIEPTENLGLQLYGAYFFMNNYDLIQDLYFTQSEDITSGLKLNWKWGKYVNVNAILHTDFYKRYKRHERRDIRKEVYHSRIWQPRINFKSSYFDNHKLIGGVDYFQDDLTSDRFVNQKMTTRGLKEWEFFAQDSYTKIDKWVLEAGVRTTFSKPFGLMILPKLAFKYSPAEMWNIRMNYSKGFRSPSIKELFFNWDHLGMFQIIGDEKLQPERNYYFSLGTEFNNKELFVSSNIYGNYFYDKIEGIWKVYDFQYNFEYMNLKHQRLLGLYILMRWKINNAFELNGSYSYVNMEDTHGVRLNTSSPHAATTGLSYKYRKLNYSLRATLTGSFTGEKEFDIQDRLTVNERIKIKNGTTVNRTISKEAFFRTELPTYFICNLNVIQTFQEHIQFSVGVNNLFNYIPTTLGSGITMFNIPATAGARGFVQIAYKF